MKHLLTVVSVLLVLVFTSTNTLANPDGGDLLRAAYSGNLSLVKSMIAAKANVNATWRDGSTALMMASLNVY